MIKILIIDDHPLVIDGIGMMLKDATYLQVIGASKSAKEALDFLDSDQPDIILLDISLPDMDGLELCEMIRKKSSSIKIIGLTSANEAGIITGLLQRGASGYLLKNMERAELIEAIDMVMDGKVFLSRAANEKVLEQFQNARAAKTGVLLTRRKEKAIPSCQWAMG